MLYAAIIVVLMVSVFTAVFGASEFQANFSRIQEGQVTRGKLYIRGSSYRLEHSDGDKRVVIIVDQRKGISSILDIGNKQYMQIQVDDFKSLSNDPFQAARYIRDEHRSERVGTEKVGGYQCVKIESSVQDKVIMTHWVSEKLSFPLKLVQHMGKQEAVMELSEIKEVAVLKELFIIPEDFEEIEDPAAARERKRKEMEAEEAALPGITKPIEREVPCMVKIGEGGVLRVPVDEHRTVKVEVRNQHKGESVVRVVPFKDGKRVENIGVSPWQFSRLYDHRDRSFNESSFSGRNPFAVDEIRVITDTGIVYAIVTQSGKYRKDFYNRGRQRIGKKTDPTKNLNVRITGDNPFNKRTSGIMILKFGHTSKREEMPFEVETGKTKSWSFPAARRIKGVDIKIGTGGGRARVSLIQPEMAKSEKKRTPARGKGSSKNIKTFSVTYPSGRGKTVSPNKDLKITVTGKSAHAKGEIILYGGVGSKDKLDEVKFELKEGQAETYSYPEDKGTSKVRVWVYKGSFEVKLEQSG